MRALFLALLLANLLFLAWSRWVVPPVPVARQAGEATQTAPRSIRLREEARAGTAGADGGPVADGAVDVAAATCVSVGPFADEAQATVAAGSLRRLGFDSRLRAAQDEVRVGYWVRVPDLTTPVDAANALAALRAAGLTDAYVIADATPGSSISIGVYSDAARAAAISETVGRAGFATQTSDRLRTQDVFWLDVDRQANGGIPVPEDVAAPASGALPLELRACPSAPAPAAVGSED